MRTENKNHHPKNNFNKRFSKSLYDFLLLNGKLTASLDTMTSLEELLEQPSQYYLRTKKSISVLKLQQATFTITPTGIALQINETIDLLTSIRDKIYLSTKTSSLRHPRFATGTKRLRIKP